MSEEMYSLGLCIMRNQVPVDSVVHISWFRLGPTVNILCRRFWLYKLDHIQTDQQPFASMTLWLASFDRNIFDNWEYELENWGRKWFFFFFPHLFPSHRFICVCLLNFYIWSNMLVGLLLNTKCKLVASFGMFQSHLLAVSSISSPLSWQHWRLSLCTTTFRENDLHEKG